MAFVEPVTLRDRGVRLEPLALEHEAGLMAAAADGELWKIRVTSVPEPQETRSYIEAALLGWGLAYVLGLDLFAPGYGAGSIAAIAMVGLGGGLGLKLARVWRSRRNTA